MSRRAASTRPRSQRRTTADIDPSGSTILSPLTPSRLGGSAHKTAYEALKRGLRFPIGAQLIDLWKDLELGEHELTWWLQERQTAVSRVDIYLNLLAPKPSWEMLGTEVPFHVPAASVDPENDSDELISGRFDVVWRTPEGGIVIDELKTGR